MELLTLIPTGGGGGGKMPPTIGEIVGFYRGGCAKYIRMKLMDAYDWLPA